MTTYAPAKINLALDVFGLRPDGFHEMITVYQSVSLYDVIEWETNDRAKFEVRCDKYEIDGKYNIIWKAVKEYFKFIGKPEKGFICTVQKNIPLQAGLGGGSSDAAAIINALARQYGQVPPMDFYAALGTDVPYFTVLGTVLGRGRGSELTILKAAPEMYAVIVQGTTRISTATAYKILDDIPVKFPISTQELINAIYAGDLNGIYKNCGNVFEQVAGEMENWEVIAIKSSLQMYGAKAACMTGSGSAVYGLFENEEQALRCEQQMKKDYRFCVTVKFIHGGG